MSIWQIPAKTFLLGEYIALIKGPALVLTTTPCFELSLCSNSGLFGIHDESPAGLWWTQHGQSNYGLRWKDPYIGIGGLGASSAQFIGSYFATQALSFQEPTWQDLLAAYFKTHAQGKGVAPSGYDLIAQLHQECVYINLHKGIIETYAWPFAQLSFALIHSGQKIATHHHLESLRLPDGLQHLSEIVETGKSALEQANATLLIESINNYQNQLEKMQLVARHSLKLIALLKKQPGILAVKGCGALGADVLLVVFSTSDAPNLLQYLHNEGLRILATQETVYKKNIK